MIAKKVPMRSIRKSDYSELVAYLTDRQGKYERLGQVWTTNCQTEGWTAAISEVLNTQVQNTRSAADKTYHLIVSFRAGELPEETVLKAIETRICKGLGFNEHQRVCVVHRDTDNLHFHIAINKIHPSRYTIHDPYNDHWTLGKLCKRLELEYGLESDNHRATKTGSEDRAADMERQAGVQSLLGWIKRGCADQLKSARSWSEVHSVMACNGLELREKGNGLVITNGAGRVVKASSVMRELSKNRLEQRLGAFEPAGEVTAKTQTLCCQRYEAQPIRSRVDTAGLYTRYRIGQQQATAACKAEKAKIADHKNRLIESAKKAAHVKRDAVKTIKGTRTSKKILYGIISRTLKDEIREINRQCRAERRVISWKYQRHTWADWLKAEATKGDQEALCALRAINAARGLTGDTVTGRAGRKIWQGGAKKDCITKKGTIIYRVGSTAVRDDGDKLKVSKGSGQEGLQAALRLAMEHYGNCIAVNGTDTFRENIVMAAAATKLPLTFADPALEFRRQELLARENAYGHNKRRTEQPGSPRLTATQPGIGGDRFDRRGAGRPGIGFASKPDIGGIGRKPPPQSKNCLRELSQLGVVHFASGAQVLLPRDVPDHLEQQGTKPDHGVRRNISGAGGIAASQAADKYIAEREATRRKVSGVPKHRRYDLAADGGTVAFAGVRQVEGQTLALLRRGEEIMALPVDADTGRRLSRLAIGDAVTVAANGSVTKAKRRKI